MENKFQCRSALISNLLKHNLAYMHHQMRIFLRIYLESAFRSILSSTKITQPTPQRPYTCAIVLESNETPELHDK